MNGKGEVFQFEKVLSHLKLTHDKFVSMCVVAGCDYLKNIKTIGIKKGKQLGLKDNFLDELQKHRYPPETYRESFFQQGVSFSTSLCTTLKQRRFILFMNGRRETE